MPDPRTLFDEAVARRVIPAPPVHTVTNRAEAIRSRQSTRRLVGAALAVVTLLLAASVTRATRDDSTTRLAARPDSPGPTTPSASTPSSDIDNGDTPSSSKKSPGAGLSTPPPPPPTFPGAPSRGPECKAGANGGATDFGVTGTRISVGMTHTRSGPNSSLVGNAHVAVKAVVDAVNRAGGICGRLLDVRMLDEPSGPSRWPRFDGTFAELVGPLQSGFDAHIADGTVDRAGVPVVGTDGLTALQFRSRWVWPVGTPAASMARIAIDHAYRSLGARTFALVYDSRHEFSTAESVVRSYVATLTGASLRAVQRVDESSAQLGRDCAGGACDVVVLAMDSNAARSWLDGNAVRGRLQTAALRFVPGRTGNCALACSTVVDVWAGYTPPVEPFVSDPDVARYNDEVGDVNPLVEGAYVGARVLVEALQRVGPTVTRERLRDVLDSMRYESDIVGRLAWGPEQRVGHASARLLRIGEAVEDGGTGWVRDPTPGVFPE